MAKPEGNCGKPLSFPKKVGNWSGRGKNVKTPPEGKKKTHEASLERCRVKNRQGSSEERQDETME
jgi:hypothetical protein